MKQCPLCGSEIPDSTSICDFCGYDFEKREVGDKTKVNMWVNSQGLERKKRVQRKMKVHELQVGKYGKKVARNKDASGWTQIKTAEILGESPANLSRDLKLAKKLKKKEAGVLAEDETGFGSEEELQKCLVNNWEKTPLAGEWDIYNKYRKGKSYAGEVGEIDILAKHRKEPRWVVIELKKDQSSDGTVGQLLRYMGWIEFDHRANAKNDRVEGLIISKSTDRSILYAVYAIRCMSNISLNRYSLEDGNLKLEEINIVHELLGV